MLRKPSFGEKKKRELKVLFVSKRDACRGPMAECIFNHLVDKFNTKSFARFNWRVQSAGLVPYNQGNLPEQFCLRVLHENSLETMHGCKQVSSRANYKVESFLHYFVGEEVENCRLKVCEKV